MKLYHNESWELMIRRWSKLVKDFKLKNGQFDISKIPDIYDCIKYDLQHNIKILRHQDCYSLHNLSKAMADIVIPQVQGSHFDSLPKEFWLSLHILSIKMHCNK